MFRHSSKILAGLLLGASASCLGGSSGDGQPEVTDFGLSVCSLGCSGGTFAMNTLEANRDVIFTFNDDVDPATVNFTSISLVNQADGTTPTGAFIVDGPRVIFRPSLIETSAGLRFGFLDGAVYDVTIIDDSSPNAVRSVKGRLNQSFITGQMQINGVADLVPGRPVVVDVSPSLENPPSGRDFEIEITFGDIMQTIPLANPDTGESNLISVVVVDSALGSETPVSGTYRSVVDRDALKTKVIFTPLVPFPGSDGGNREVHLNLSQQISDLVGNQLLGAGVVTIPLPDLPTITGSFGETFGDHAKEDDSGSVNGLWAAPAGALGSGQDPLTGLHKGGGSGVLGKWDVPGGTRLLDTDGMTFPSVLLGEDVTVNGGVFMFDEVHLGVSANVLATGSNPLRLYARGAMQVDGVIRVDGQDAPSNFGKYRPLNEQETGTLGEEPNTNMETPDLHNGGGDPGTGDLAAGSGGKGGQAWYYEDEGFGTQFYYNMFQSSWVSGSPNRSRFKDGLTGDEYTGRNGDGVGGVAAIGFPLTGPATNLRVDRANGSGMGSWNWPPASQQILDQTFANPVEIESHLFLDSQGQPTGRDYHALHRSRGGGGGGFWTDGGRGEHFDVTATDPLGNALAPDFTPFVDVSRGVWEYNGDGNGNDWFEWDVRITANGGTPEVPDAAGGAYEPPANAETLDPEAGLLLGGAGGGGAGMSEHGSWNETPTISSGTIGTFRSCTGAGGGAGGGALQLHCGSRLTINGLVSADGGDGGDSEFMLSLPYVEPLAIIIGTPGDAGGGGGSGGSVLAQVGGSMQVVPDGISVRGGVGGKGSAGNFGGNGGSGLVRFDTRTGSQSLAQLEAMVAPDAAVNLDPVGQTDVPNVGTVAVSLPGTVGDVTASDGTVFNGNASGVRSRWYEGPLNVSQFKLDAWEVDVEWRDAGGVQTATFSDQNVTDPGVTPIWIGLQAGWLQPGAASLPNPQIQNLGDWVIPGFAGESDGLDTLNANIIRAVRFTIVFDQDLVNALIGGVAGGYYRVTDVRFEFTGD